MKTKRYGHQVAGMARFTAKRSRAVPVVGVVGCSTCHVGIDNKCINLTTGETTNVHPKRRQMAVRADNLARGIR